MPSIGIADKTTLDAVNTKVGVNTDVAGTSTLFARLAQIAAYVDTLETLIGTASPTSGDLTTLFKGLKLIADYVDTLETKLGLNTDGAGTSTVFARLAQIAGYTDTLEILIGTANPASGGTDTLFKYLKKIFDGNIQAGQYRSADFFQNSPTANTWYTVLDITGIGVLTRISAFVGAPTCNNSYVEVKITIDGISYTADLSTVTRTRGIAGCEISARYDYIDIITNVRFDSSLKIEVQTTTSSPSELQCSVDYGLI